MSNKESSFISQILKAVCMSIIITLIAIFIFGLVVKFAELNGTIIRIINQFIKTVAIFSGCYFALSNDKGYLKGGVVGFFATLLTYLIFILISGQTGTVTSFLLDVLFGILIGIISGVLTINLRYKKA